MSEPSTTITFAPEAAFLLHNSLAPSTRKKYNKILRGFEAFCQQHHYKPYPSSFDAVSHWLAKILSSVKPTTAKSYIGALRAFHIENGMSNAVLKDPRLDLIIRGGRRVYGEGARTVRYPITSDILLRMLSEIGDDEEGVNIKAALCVGFAAFLRSGELTWNTWAPNSHHFLLSRGHVAFNSTSVTLTLPSSKTDQFRAGTEIYLAYCPHSLLCPVTALRTLFTRYPRPPPSPLFTRPYGQPFSKVFLVLKMRELLLHAGISTIGYSGHSLRKGAAVTARRNGITREDIKLLGRWKSDAV